MYQENSEEELKAMQTYGFANQRSGVFARLQVSLRLAEPVSHLVSGFRSHFAPSLARSLWRVSVGSLHLCVGF